MSGELKTLEEIAWICGQVEKAPSAALEEVHARVLLRLAEIEADGA